MNKEDMQTVFLEKLYDPHRRRYSSTAVSRNNMGDHGDRSVALHHIRTEPESHTRRTASLCGSLSWFHL